MKLNIEQFNPTKAEINKLVERSKDLAIRDIDDKIGYEQVKVAQIELRDIRIKIQKTGKEMRAEALKFQKDVIAKEKEYISTIEPVESELKEKRRLIDEEKEKLERVKYLFERKTKLKKIGINLTDEEVISIKDFDSFYNEKNALFLEEKARKLAEETERIAREKREYEEKIRREAELKKAKAEAEERTKREYEEKIKREAEEKERKKMQEKIRLQEENERMEKDKKYQEFLIANNYSEKTDKIERTGKKVMLYRLINTLEL